MLAFCVVDKHHRESEDALPVHCLKPEDAGRGLFAAAYYAGNEVRIVFVDHVDKVAAVVYDDVGTRLNDTPDAAFVFSGCGAVDRKHIEALMDKGCRNVVLRAQGVASGDEHLCPSARKDFAEACGLGFKMD